MVNSQDRLLAKRQDQTIQAYRQGSAYRWCACLAASRVVGAYDRGATRKLAHELSLSVSQVENLAKAGLTYRLLRKFGVGSEVRRKLTPGHYTAVGELMRWYDLPPEESADLLKLAAEHGASIVAMKSLVRDSFGDYVPWAKRFDDVKQKIGSLVDDYETPYHVRLVFKAFLRRLDKVS